MTMTLSPRHGSIVSVLVFSLASCGESRSFLEGGSGTSNRCDGVDCGNGRCVEEPTAHCDCNAGYVAQDLVCVPWEDSLCADTECGANSECVVQDDEAACQCLPGYEASASGCVRTAPCDDASCGPNGECVEDNGSARCACHDGYEPRALSCVPASGSPPTSLSLPLRGAFYYPWYPATWTVNGQHVFYEPDVGYYDSDSSAVADRHIECFDYAKIDVAIASWWGVNAHGEDVRIPMFLSRTEAKGSDLRWAVYYEKEGFDRYDTSVSALKADLDYLTRYTSFESYAHVNDKPVVFVYNANDTSCDVADRWSQASDGQWYVVLKVFDGFRDCTHQPDSWHQYGPATATQEHEGYSFAISPGFWRADEQQSRLQRNPAQWWGDVRSMVASGQPWQLITTFNEWGEGTAVEPARQWSSESGYGTYLDALHEDGVGASQGGGGTGQITHVGTTEVYDSNGQNMVISRPSGSTTGDLLTLFVHRTDDDLPLRLDGWTKAAECYKRDNGYACSTEEDCISWHDASFCGTFEGGHGGHDLAQAVFYRAVGTDEPSSYELDLNRDDSGHPGWAILTALRGADSGNPVRDWAHMGCDGHPDSVFPSVYGEDGDWILLSQSFDDQVAESKFGAPTGTSTLGYTSQSDEAGFLFGGVLGSTGETGEMKTQGDGASNCKDALISLTIRPE